MDNYEKKFEEEMDKFIEGFDDEKHESFNKETVYFSLLNEFEKVKAYDQLLTKAILNKKYYIRRTKDHIKSSIEMLDIIKKVIISNASTDVILDTIDVLKSSIEDDFNSVEEKMRYCKK